MAVVVNGGEQASLTFAMKTGLVRESVRVDLAAYDRHLTTEMLRDIAFAFLDRNVRDFLFLSLQYWEIFFYHLIQTPTPKHYQYLIS